MPQAAVSALTPGCAARCPPCAKERASSVGSSAWRASHRSRGGQLMMVRASAVILVAAQVASHACAADIGYLARPGVPTTEFPAPQRREADGVIAASGADVADRQS